MPTFTGVECRLGALLGTVQTTPNIDLQRAKLVIMLSGTGQAEAAARVACASGDVKGTRRGLKKAGNRVRQFLSRLRRPSVKRSIPPLLRADFIENGDGIRSTLKTLRMTVACPGDATS